MVRGHPLGPEPLGQVAGHPLDQAPRVDEHERGAVRAGQLGHAIVDLLPLLVGAHRAQLVADHLDGQIHVAALPHVDDLGQRPVRAHQQPRRGLDRPHGGREADALQARAPRGHQLGEALEREGQVRAALVAGHRVDLVHDHGAHVGEPATARLGGEQDEERLGRGHHHVRRAAAHQAALVRGGVAGAHRGADLGRGQSRRDGRGGQLAERLVQVAPDVVGERLERRHVEDLGPVGQPTVHRLAEEPVQTGQEGGERLARAGGRGEQHVLAVGDQRPRAGLHRGGLGVAGAEPRLDDGVEHRNSIVRLTRPSHLRSLVASWRPGTRR